MQDEASYICGACGEDIVIPLDVSAGGAQQFVEDCPVCCRPNVVSIEVDRSGSVFVRSELES